MGLWRKLLGREEEPASPFGTPEPAATPGEPGAPTTGVTTPLVSFQSTPTEATWSTVMVNGQQLPPEQAQAFTQAFERLGNLASFGTSQVIDLSHDSAAREKVLAAMRDHAGDPAALQGAVTEALQGAQGARPAAPPASDPLERLEKLDELRDQGVLTDAEFDAQKKKLLEEL